MKNNICFIVAVVILPGCASIGHDFQYQSDDSYGRPTLELGMPSAKYANMFGEPLYSEIKDTSDGKFRIDRYQYSSANMSSAHGRLLDLEFRNEVLNAYVYISSFEEDKTMATIDQLIQVKRGTSKDSDVLKYLGKPHSVALCPSAHPDFKDKCNKDKKTAKIWAWTVMDGLSTLGSVYGGKQIKIKTVIISFDKDNVVINIESFSNNQ